MYLVSYSLVLLICQLASLATSKAVDKRDRIMEADLVEEASFTALHLMAEDKLGFSS